MPPNTRQAPRGKCPSTSSGAAPKKKKGKKKRKEPEQEDPDYTQPRQAVPLCIRLQVETRCSRTGQPSIKKNWHNSTGSEEKDMGVNSAAIKLQDLMEFVAKALEDTPPDEGKILVAKDVYNTGNILYCWKEGIIDLDATGSSSKSMPLASDDALKKAINESSCKTLVPNTKGKVGRIALDVLVTAKFVKPKATKARAATALSQDGTDDESTVEGGNETPKPSKKASTEDKNTSIEFCMMHPTFIQTKKNSEETELVVLKDKHVNKMPIRIDADGETRIQLADLIAGAQEEAFGMTAYKTQTSDEEEVTLISNEATLVHPKRSNSKVMVALESTQELWEHLRKHRKKVGKASDDTIGDLCFSIVARKLDSNETKHAPVDLECLAGPPIPECTKMMMDNPEGFASPATAPKTRHVTASGARCASSWNSSSTKEASEFTHKLFNNKKSLLCHGFQNGQANVVITHFATNIPSLELMMTSPYGKCMQWMTQLILLFQATRGFEIGF